MIPFLFASYRAVDRTLEAKKKHFKTGARQKDIQVCKCRPLEYNMKYLLGQLCNKEWRKRGGIEQILVVANDDAHMREERTRK